MPPSGLLMDKFNKIEKMYFWASYFLDLPWKICFCIRTIEKTVFGQINSKRVFFFLDDLQVMKNFFIWNKNGFSNTATFMFYSYHQINIIFSWPELMNGFFKWIKKTVKKVIQLHCEQMFSKLTFQCKYSLDHSIEFI